MSGDYKRKRLTSLIGVTICAITDDPESDCIVFLDKAGLPFASVQLDSFYDGNGMYFRDDRDEEIQCAKATGATS